VESDSHSGRINGGEEPVGVLTYRRYLGIGVLLGAEGYLCMVDTEPF
jgi:hypothetical protein